MPTDLLGRTPISDAVKANIESTFQHLDHLTPGSRAAMLLVTYDEGVARAIVAAKLGENWRVAAGGGYEVATKNPSGFVEIVWSK